MGIKVWLLHPGETIPTETGFRAFRYRQLGEHLVASGNQVVQWTATFNHFSKTQRADHHLCLDVKPNYRVQMLYGGGYQSHVSPQRWLFNRRVARAFTEVVQQHEPPDVVVSSIPTLELSAAVLRYCQVNQVPIAIDIRDLWPDVHLKVLPRALRPFARPLLAPTYRATGAVCRQATAIYGVSEDYLSWGLRYARRERQERDRVFYLGCDRAEPPRHHSHDLIKKLEVADAHGEPTLRCCYFGVLGKSSGVDAVIEVARRLVRMNRSDIQFVICGRGPNEDHYREMASDLSNVRFLGWVTPQEISQIMEVSHIGLAIYSRDATQSLPNKPIEYMAGGLALLSTLPGELERLIADQDCGATYHSDEIAGMADQLTRWADQPELRNHQGQRSAKVYAERFSAARVYPQMITSLEQLSLVKPVQTRNLLSTRQAA